jgi:hypothetical protein
VARDDVEQLVCEHERRRRWRRRPTPPAAAGRSRCRGCRARWRRRGPSVLTIRISGGSGPRSAATRAPSRQSTMPRQRASCAAGHACTVPAAKSRNAGRETGGATPARGGALEVARRAIHASPAPSTARPSSTLAKRTRTGSGGGSLPRRGAHRSGEHEQGDEARRRTASRESGMVGYPGPAQDSRAPTIEFAPIPARAGRWPRPPLHCTESCPCARDPVSAPASPSPFDCEVLVVGGGPPAPPSPPCSPNAAAT